MKNNDDLETVSRLCAEILQVIIMHRTKSSFEVALRSNIDQKQVKKFLRLLSRKGFIMRFEHDSRTWYSVTPAGITFAENLDALMSGHRLLDKQENLGPSSF